MPPLNPKVKKIVERCEKNIKKVTQSDAIVILVFCKPDLLIEYEQVVQIVCNVTGIPAEKAFYDTREGEIVLTRQLIAFYAKTICGISYKRIGQLFGKKDHTTAMSNVNKIKSLLATGDKYVWLIVNKINAQLEQLKSAA
jgi:chromosomal replication initiator protein